VGLKEEDQIKAIMVGIFLIGLAGLVFTGSILGLGGADYLSQFKAAIPSG
jgi:ABC-type transporter Mla maintaining outer membrane lipid asymmetry permease subunit MlaE